MDGFDKEQLVDLYLGGDISFDDSEGRYVDFTSLGKGAIKEVKKCYDRDTKRFVAHATVRDDIDRGYNEYFLHEAWLTASLKHPNIIKVLDIGEDEATGRSYFTMDLKANRTLKDVVAEGASLRELLTIYATICNAMAYAHSEKVLHLDLKPDNIQCDRFGEVLVCDWGLWKSLSHDEERDYERVETLVGEVKGSLGYMAPEQVTNEGEKTHLTDLYSLGCILYFILTGEPPYVGAKQEVLDRTANEDLVSFRNRYPGREIPRALEAVVLKAMSREPSYRYQSVHELLQEVNLYLDRGTTLAENPSVLRRMTLLLSRHMQMTMTVSFFTVLVSVLVTGAYILVNEGEKQRLLVASELGEAKEVNDDLSSQLGVIEEALPEIDSAVDVMISEADKRMFAPNNTDGKYDQQKIQEAIWLYEQAYKIEPDCIKARWRLVHYYFFLLDFDAVNQFEPVKGDTGAVAYYLQFAKQYSGRSYSLRQRPSISELVDVLRIMIDDQGMETIWLHQMLKRDFSFREKDEDLSPIFLEMLRFYNREHLEGQQYYDDKTGTLVFDVKGKLFLPYWQGKFKILPYFKLKCLKLSGELVVEHLGELQVEELDLSEVEILSSRRCPINAKGLKRLIVSESDLAWARSVVFPNSSHVEIMTK